MNIRFFFIIHKLGLLLVLLSLASNSFGRDHFRFASSAKNPKMSLVSYDRDRDPISYPCEMPGGITFGGRFGDGVVEGQVDLLAPLTDPYQSGIATFLMLNYLHTDYGQESFGVGLGTRWMMESLNSVAGFRIHGDFSDTALGNSISQLNFGFDLFHGKGFDLHANYYLPTSGAQRGTYRLHESSTTTNSYTNEYGDDPYATGHEILQDYTRVEYEQTTTTDITRIMQQFERGREGGDLRLMFDIIGKECGPKVRGMVGAYAYDGLYSDNLFGAMAGLYAFPVSGLQVGVEYYGDEELYGSNWVGTVGASIQTDFQNMFRPSKWGKGGNPYAEDPYLPSGKSGKFCAPAPQSDYLASRMYATAPRINRPILEHSAVTEDITQRIVETTTTDTPIDTTSGTKVLLDNVIFVNNGAAVGNGIEAGTAGGSGTAEAPVDTIQGGTVALANNLGGVGNVYVQGGTGTAYTETVQAGHGAGAGVTSVTYYSSFKGIEGCEAKVFGGNTDRAQVVGGFDLRNLSHGEVRAFDISGGIAGAFPGAVPDQGAAGGFGILSLNNDTFVANCNTIGGITDVGIMVFNDTVTNGSATVTENVVDVSGTPVGTNGINVILAGVGNFLSLDTVNNSVINAPECAIHVEAFDNARVLINQMDNNTLQGSGNVGFSVTSNDTSNIQIDSMRGNRVDGNTTRIDPNDNGADIGASVRFIADNDSAIVASNVSENRIGENTPLSRGTGAGNLDAEHGFRIIERGAGAGITVSGNDNTVTWDGPAAVGAGDSGNSVFATGDTIAAGAGGFEVNNADVIFGSDPYRFD